MDTSNSKISVFVKDDIDAHDIWEYYHTYLESPGSFFLEVAKNQYNIIPKRVLGTKEQVDAFRVLVKKHLVESSELEREKRMKQKD